MLNKAQVSTQPGMVRLLVGLHPSSWRQVLFLAGATYRHVESLLRDAKETALSLLANLHTWNDASVIASVAEKALLPRRAAYVGVNTWDLMDKSRDKSARPEVLSRLDAMVKAGWSVGRTWGFSLGSGLTDSPLGNVIADPTKVLETAPGERTFSEMVLRHISLVILAVNMEAGMPLLQLLPWWHPISTQKTCFLGKGGVTG